MTIRGAGRSRALGNHAGSTRASCAWPSRPVARDGANRGKAGADILVHSVADRELDDEFVAEVVRRNVIYVPMIIVGRLERRYGCGR